MSKAIIKSLSAIGLAGPGIDLTEPGGESEDQLTEAIQFLENQLGLLDQTVGNLVKQREDVMAKLDHDVEQSRVARGKIAGALSQLKWAQDRRHLDA